MQADQNPWYGAKDVGRSVTAPNTGTAFVVQGRTPVRLGLGASWSHNAFSWRTTIFWLVQWSANIDVYLCREKILSQASPRSETPNKNALIRQGEREESPTTSMADGPHLYQINEEIGWFERFLSG
jgi:hypothetical protein